MKKFALLFLASLAFIACDKEDTEKPVISITAPSEGKEVEPGESFTVKGTITDNENLSQYKIDFHHAGDGHEHKSSAGEFDFEKIENIEGESYSLSVDISVPGDAEEGIYHLIVEATDESGNEADFVEIEVEIHAH